MSINSYLQTLATDLCVVDSEENRIETSITTIKSRLTFYFGIEIIEKKVFGSYDRDTILTRKSDDDSDVDIMVVFDNANGYKPQTYLNRLKKFAEHYYSSSEIYQSSPTIVLELNHIKFELVPAQKEHGSYYIPEGASEWKYTNPDALKDTVNSSNRNNRYRVKPVLRLLKHWNVNKNYRDMASYLLEETVSNDLMYAYGSCSMYVDYIKCALKAIKYKTDYTRVQSALNHIDKALEYEASNMPFSADAEIKKAFPEV